MKPRPIPRSTGLVSAAFQILRKGEGTKEPASASKETKELAPRARKVAKRPADGPRKTKEK